MTLEIRDKNSPAGVFYNPGRDLAYAYPEMLKIVAERFDRGQWPALKTVCDQAGVTYDQLCDAYQALNQCLVICTESPDETMHDVVERGGWLKQPDVAQVAIMAQLGSVVFGQLFHAAREHANDPSQLTEIEKMAAAALESSKVMRLGGARLRWARFAARLRHAWESLTGKNDHKLAEKVLEKRSDESTTPTGSDLPRIYHPEGSSGDGESN